MDMKLGKDLPPGEITMQDTNKWVLNTMRGVMQKADRHQEMY